jgi:hypothetical protein
MADHGTLEGKMEALSKQIDTQARFTRGVILLCTSAIIAAMFYTIIEVLTTLPRSLVAATEDLHRLSHQNSAAQATNKTTQAAQTTK